MTAVESVALTLCSINDSWTGPCQSEGAVSVTTGCVHEHISREPVCDLHLSALMAEPVYCHYCHDVDGHFCRVGVAQ